MIREAIREAIIGGKGKKPRTIHITIHITIPSGKAKRYEREYQAKKGKHPQPYPASSTPRHPAAHRVHTAYRNAHRRTRLRTQAHRHPHRQHGGVHTRSG